MTAPSAPGDERADGRADERADGSLDELRAAAFAAMARAYAPYSRFRVGAALLTADGAIVTGCNVENAAYPSSICAERGAVMAAIAAGHRAFRLLVLATEADEPAPPCGQCRQVLVEFAPRLPVVSVSRGGAERRWTMAELLPSPFLPASLEAHAAGVHAPNPEDHTT